MTRVVVDTDVVSFIFKSHPIGAIYEADLAGCTLMISFMTLAELDRWAIQSKWGPARRELVAAVSAEIRDAPIQPQTLHLVGQRNRGRAIARVPDRVCRRLGRRDGVAPRCASRDAQSQRLSRRAGPQTDLPRVNQRVRPYPRHATPTFNFFFAYSKLRSRSTRCCSFSASSMTAGFFPATSSITIAPMNG